MLEDRKAYSNYNETGDNGTIEVNMSYRDYKNKYSDCKTLKDYDNAKKTITVLIPKDIYEKSFKNTEKFRYSYVKVELTFNTGGENPRVFNNELRYKNLDGLKRQLKKFQKEDGFISYKLIDLHLENAELEKLNIY